MAPPQEQTNNNKASSARGNVRINVLPPSGDGPILLFPESLSPPPSPRFPLLDNTTAKRRQILTKRKLQQQQKQNSDAVSVISLPSQECLCQVGLMEAATAAAAGIPLLDVTSAKRRLMLIKKERACTGEPCCDHTICLPSQECLCQFMMAAAHQAMMSHYHRHRPLLDITTAKRRKILIQKEVAYSGGNHSDSEKFIIIPLPWSQVCILQEAKTFQEMAAFCKAHPVI